MKKKFLVGLLALVICFTLVGCGNKNAELNDNAQDNTSQNQTDTSNNSNENNIELYSDNTKIVFQSGNSKLVYYYSGDKITKYESYFDYGDSATAKYALSVLEKDQDIKNVYTKGKYLVIEYNESVYEGATVSDIKALYSYLEEVKK